MEYELAWTQEAWIIPMDITDFRETSDYDGSIYSIWFASNLFLCLIYVRCTYRCQHCGKHKMLFGKFCPYCGKGVR